MCIVFAIRVLHIVSLYTFDFVQRAKTSFMFLSIRIFNKFPQNIVDENAWNFCMNICWKKSLQIDTRRYQI